MPRLNQSLAAQAAAPAPTPSAPAPEATNPEKAGAVVPVPTAGGALQRYAVARPLDVEPPGARTPYASVYHPTSKKAAAISKAVPNIQEGQVVVILEDGSILSVLKLHLLHARQYWVQMAYGDGEVLAVSREKPSAGAALEEHVESLVLCYTPKVVAAKASWRKTRSPFAKTMAAALRQREGRWMDFTGVPVVEARTNRTSGKPYTLVTAEINPTNTDEARLLQEWVEDAAAQAEFNQVEAVYQDRLRYLDGKAQSR